VEDKEYREMGTNAYRPGGRPDTAGVESERAASVAEIPSLAEQHKENLQETLADMYETGHNAGNKKRVGRLFFSLL